MAWGQCFVKQGFKAILENIESMEDEPATSKTEKNIDKIQDLLCLSRRLTVRMIGEQLNLITQF